MKDIIYVRYVFGNVTLQKCYQAVGYLHIQKSQINVIINLCVWEIQVQCLLQEVRKAADDHPPLSNPTHSLYSLLI